MALRVVNAVFASPAGGGLPEAPPESTRPYLDAAMHCVERFGWARTSVRDVAREAGVERTTVYRHVGSMETIFALLVARELHELMADIPTMIPAGVTGPRMVVEIVAAAVERSLRHPVVAKVLADEPELAGTFLLDAVPDIVERVTATLNPAVAAAMAAGLLAERNPEAVTQWVVRLGLSLLIAPPPGDLRGFLEEVLIPLLDPPKVKGPKGRASR